MSGIEEDIMALNNPYAKLKSDAIYTTTPEELTLMLYDGALKFGNRAIIEMEKNDYIQTNVYIQKMKNIIREFQFTLKDGYEISTQLNAMYEYIHRVLTEANVKKDMDKLNEAMDLIRQLRDTWKEAIVIYRSGRG